MPAPSLQTAIFSVDITAPAASVWAALTDRRQTPRFYFGHRVESDWRADSTITYHGPAGFDLSGRIVHVEPARMLVHSFTDRTPEGEDPTAWVSWQLEEVAAGRTRVTVAVDELGRGDDDGEQAWPLLLSNLKLVVELSTAAARTPRPRGGESDSLDNRA